MSIDYLRLYNHILSTPRTPNLRLQKEGTKNAKGSCPFCESNSLSIHLETGRGQCFSCNVQFNIISFITRYHNEWLNHTPDDYYNEIEDARGIPVSILKKAKLAFDAYNNRWLVPYKNPSSPYLQNLGNFRTEGDLAYKCFVMPNENGLFPKRFYNPFSFQKEPKFKEQQVVICEGEWDALALLAMIEAGYGDDLKDKIPAVLGCPGATIIPTGTIELLKNYKEILIAYDNDDPGRTGSEGMATYLSAEGKRVKRMNWDALDSSKPYPAKYDLRDLWTEENRNFAFVYPAFETVKVETESKDEPEVLGPGYISTVESIDPVNTLTDYFKLYEEHMFLTEVNRNAIIAGLAVSVGTLLPGEPLWVFLIGPASSGKTTFIESFGGKHEWCDYASKLTAKSLISGWAAGEPSAIPKMNNKCFFIKDFTVVLGMPKDQQRELFDILRDVYDGSIKIIFGNGQVRNFQNLNFNLIAGVTPAIHKLNDSQLGERFLRINYAGSERTSQESLMATLRNFGRTTQKKDDLTRATIGYVKQIRNHFWKPETRPQLQLSHDMFIANLANYIAYVRTKPEHNRVEGLIYRPSPEDPPRLALQLKKLAYATEKVLHPTESSDSDLKLCDRTEHILTKVAHDTCEGFNQEIVKAIYQNPKISQANISRTLAIPPTRTNRVLDDLKIVGLVKTITQLSGATGRPTILYRLDDTIQELAGKLYGD